MLNETQQTTYEDHRQHLIVPWADPASLPRKTTTYDAVNQRLTVPDRPAQIGETQVMGGITYRWNGSSWVPSK